ncbi:MAG: hypothetical protein AAF919_03640 [Pseudomonadota bacterium]
MARFLIAMGMALGISLGAVMASVTGGAATAAIETSDAAVRRSTR